MLAILVGLAGLPGQGAAQFLPDGTDYWWMRTDDQTVHFVIEVGKNPVSSGTFVVLQGGYGSEHSYLVDMVRPLSDRYRFVLPDQRGSLRSPAPDSTITFEAFVSDLDHLREELGLDRLQLIAHSNGANIALDYLGRYPERVAGLVLLAPPLSFLHGDAFEEGLLDELIQEYRVASEALNAEIAPRIQDALLELGLEDPDEPTDRQRTIRSRVEYAGWHTTDPFEWEQTRNAFFEPSVMKALQENVDPDQWRARPLRKSEAFATARIPIRVILGDADFVDPGGVVWAGLIGQTGNGRLTILDGAGHNAWIDQPHDFGHALRRHLGEIAGH